MGRPKNHIQFKDPKTPYSEQFGDVYFANEVGVEESIYVYLEGAGVASAIRNGKKSIRVGEVGFGVGLNFILTLRAFLAESTPGQRLHYISAEKFPIEAEDLTTLYEAYPDLLPFAELLLKQYPILTPGLHRLFFADCRLILDLLIGDAAEQFEKHFFEVDHWYWDGFAPNKNPEAFSESLFTAVQKRSSLGARGTSFTAAGWVRRSLQVRGFQVSKRQGFGKKRECIEAVLITRAPPVETAAWFSRGKFLTLKKGDKIAVLGAGLAGSAIARSLANRGFEVEVYDANGIAQRASSNSAALFNIQLSKKPNPISQFAQAALTHFLRELEYLKIPKRLGVFRKEESALTCLETSEYPDSFYEPQKDGVYFPFCGMIQPGKLCRERLNHPQVHVIQHSISKVVKNGTSFDLFDHNQTRIGNANHIIYTLGADLALSESPLKHELLADHSINPVRGQTLLVEATRESGLFSEIRVESGYVTPVASEITGHEFHLLGATYQTKEIAPNQIELDTEFLLNDAQEKWPEFKNIRQDLVKARSVGFRASTPDKLPLVGPLSDPAFAKIHYGRALKGANLRNLPALEVQPGEWILMGLGSRGVSFSSLAAEILASLMCDLPLPIDHDLFTHLHPVRFTIRSLKKTAPHS